MSTTHINETISSNERPNGRALEDISDQIDNVNILRADAEKDESEFRNYKEASEKVKAFYKEYASTSFFSIL